MLTGTFCCFRGIGEDAEHSLWERGCLTWQAFQRLQRLPFSEAKTQSVLRQMGEARIALQAGIADWFLNRLTPATRIRVLPHFPESTGYIDIETTGLSLDHEITTVALYDGSDVSVFVQGQNLPDLLKELPRFRLLVTYNGARFDLPFLRKRFGVDLQTPHLDLMPVLRQLGLRGGQKHIEKCLGLVRNGAEDADGRQAVELWHRYRDGDADALVRLARYNARDTVNLAALAVEAYNRSVQPYPMSIALPSPNPVDLGFIRDTFAL